MKTSEEDPESTGISLHTRLTVSARRVPKRAYGIMGPPGILARMGRLCGGPIDGTNYLGHRTG